MQGKPLGQFLGPEALLQFSPTREELSDASYLYLAGVYRGIVGGYEGVSIGPLEKSGPLPGPLLFPDP